MRGIRGLALCRLRCVGAKPGQDKTHNGDTNGEAGGPRMFHGRARRDYGPQTHEGTPRQGYHFAARGIQWDKGTWRSRCVSIADRWLWRSLGLDTKMVSKHV